MSIHPNPDIFYTHTDEAPALATASLLPIIKHFASAAGITFGVKDISLTGRIIANFPDNLEEGQKQLDALAELGKLVEQPEANIIKLPNISASIPQLQAAIAELQSHGYDVPNYPEEPNGSDEQFIQDRYKAVLGSAVNPVLRQGNADRRPIPAAKAYAKLNPPEAAAWDKNSGAHVAHMMDNDFFANERSAMVNSEQIASIEFAGEDGKTIIFNPRVKLQKDEVIDTTYMSVAALRGFIKEQMQSAKDQGILFSVHLKATMMKVSDPEIFGHIVEVFFEDVFIKHADLFEELGVNANNGISDIEAKIKDLPSEQQDEIRADIQAAMDNGPELMMVKHQDEETDEEIYITNLHLPNKVIIDASIPPILARGGKARGPDGQNQDTKIVVPDTTYASTYRAMEEDLRQNGAFDPATMGSVFNIGLMAQKAEEYGSHNNTFIAPSAGTIQVKGDDGLIHEHKVEKGDIWRMCQTKDAPIKNWIELAVNRTRITGAPAVFWLDKNRPHDAELIKKVNEHIATLDTEGLDIQIMAPQDAVRYTNNLLREGKNVNAVTGNVLRDYVTDLYPILELGTSSKMVSLVPLMKGGAMFETGAGGTAPDLVQQVLSDSHLTWDSLGEFAAIAVSFDHLGRANDNDKATILGKTLDKATAQLLNHGQSPSPETGELDNKGSHFHLAKYWAQELAAQEENTDLSDFFIPIAKGLADNEEKILEEIMAVEGQEADIGGYYHPNAHKLSAAMRPSRTMNNILTM